MLPFIVVPAALAAAAAVLGISKRPERDYSDDDNSSSSPSPINENYGSDHDITGRH